MPALPPSVAGLDALAACVDAHKDAARRCLDGGDTVVRYPWLGPPAPNQPKTCRFVGGDGRVCGVGGHTSKTHARPVRPSTRALMQAVWLLQNMELLAHDEAVKQIMAMFHVLCALELRRQDGTGGTAEIKSILVMYHAVVDVFAETTQLLSKVTARPNVRSTTHILNDLLPRLAGERPAANVAEACADVQEPALVLFLFPLSDGGHALGESGEAQPLRGMYEEALATQDPTLVARMAQGHSPGCPYPGFCDMHGGAGAPAGSSVYVDRVDDGVVGCHRCGLIGHNRGSCCARTTATHVATALATLLDPCKASRITAKAAHVSLYNCYQVITTLLYKWVRGGGATWRIEGLARLRPVECAHPALLLRLFNHAVATLKSQPKFGAKMLVVSRPTQVMLEAAHTYTLQKPTRKLRPRTAQLKQTAQEASEAFDDEDMARPRPLTMTMTPAKHRAVDRMVQTSAKADPRLAHDLRAHESEIGFRFAFEDIAF